MTKVLAQIAAHSLMHLPSILHSGHGASGRAGKYSGLHHYECTQGCTFCSNVQFPNTPCHDDIKAVSGVPRLSWPPTKKWAFSCCVIPHNLTCMVIKHARTHRVKTRVNTTNIFIFWWEEFCDAGPLGKLTARVWWAPMLLRLHNNASHFWNAQLSL